jgi:large subunit ribosomal protein L13
VKTTTLKKSEFKKEWHILDATDISVGRLASRVSIILKGKNKPQFSPNLPVGDGVIILNTDKIKFSGNKNTDKKYYKHTGHPGGIKEITPLGLKNKNKTAEILKLAVKRMLPGGPLAKKQLTKLKIYNGDKHPHDVQQPKIIDFEKLNKLNIVR